MGAAVAGVLLPEVNQTGTGSLVWIGGEEDIYEKLKAEMNLPWHCSAITLKGTECDRSVRRLTTFCWQHSGRQL